MNHARAASETALYTPAAYVVGVVGGIGSGKSFVARALADRGAALISADAAGHAALRLPRVKQDLRAAWGESVFDSGGELDRRRVAQIVFAPPPEGPRQLRLLESITHPEIGRSLEREIRECFSQGRRVAVVDAALLFEAGWDRLCDTIVFVHAPEEVRRCRALGRGWSVGELVAREAAQMSLEGKRQAADVVIDNAVDSGQTLGRIRYLWNHLIHPRACVAAWQRKFNVRMELALCAAH